MEVVALQNTGRKELEDRMDVNAVLLLREMHSTGELGLRVRLFEQAADQEASLISEVLEGSVVTDFSFEVHDGKLFLIQPNGMTDWQQMHQHGVLRARAKAAEDPQYAAYVEMSEGELEESRIQEAMVAAGRPAVMVKLSLSGDDVMAASRLKTLGRDPEQQRAYLRTSVFDGRQMHIHSRSIDGLNISDGRGITTGWGTWAEARMSLPSEASSIDILKTQLYFDETQMSITQMHQLADKLVAAYDTLQTRRTGKAHKAGRAPEGVDTYQFVLDNRDLLAAHMDSLVSLADRRELPIGHLAAITNDLRYDIMSSFKQRLEGNWVDHGSLGESVAWAGETERAIGTQYGGCDTVISSNLAGQAGYVNGPRQMPTKIERQRTTRELRENVIGKGGCTACGAGGKLFGCGLCSACNNEWCDIYERNGTQTPVRKLSRFNPRRLADDIFEAETIGQQFARLEEERRLEKLQNEAELAYAV